MKLKQIVESALGNILEWLDFGLFIFLTPLIGEIFFPTNDKTLSTIAALGVFAAGFISRPIGGIIFGHFGDKIGRAFPLRVSVLIITLSTFFIGCLPTYASIGIAAPILFTLFRIFQGIAIGGEYGGIMTYLAESAPFKKRGFITSFAATGANLGFLLATCLVLALQHFFSDENMKAYGWRLPFLFIGLIGSVVIYFRLRLTETASYKKFTKTHIPEKAPLLTALRSAPKSLGIIFGLNAMSCTFYYIFFGYMPDYLQHYGNFSSQHAFFIESCALVGMLFLVPCMGYLGDKIGRRTMLLITTGSMGLLALPFFWVMQFHLSYLVALILGGATLLSSLDQGNTLTAIVETCPMNVRYSSIAFAYNISAAIFGGLSPIIVISLIEKFNPIAPGFYILFTSTFGFISAWFLSKTPVEDLSFI